MKRATLRGRAPGGVHHLDALRRPIFTCSARYTWPLPPSPSFFIICSGRPAPGPRDPASAPTSAASPVVRAEPHVVAILVAQTGQIFTSDLDPQQLVATRMRDWSRRPCRRGRRARCRCGCWHPPPRVPHLRSAPGHGVRSSTDRTGTPIALLAAMAGRRGRGKLITRARCVGRQLGEARDVGARDEAAHPRWWRRRRAGAAPGTPAAGTGSPGSRSCSRSPSSSDAPPQEHTSRCGCPGRRTTRRASSHESFAFNGREEHVFGEADVAVLTADGRVGRRALEALHGAAQIVEQHERDRRSRPRGPERPRRAAARSASGAPQVAQNLIPVPRATRSAGSSARSRGP